MNETQLELTRLIGSKELTFGCVVKPKNPDIFRWKSARDFAIVYKYEEEGHTWMAWSDGDLGKEDSLEFIEEFETIGHPATLSDLHRWLSVHDYHFVHNSNHHSTCLVLLADFYGDVGEYLEKIEIKYDSSLDLLDQSESTLQAIINLIKETGQPL